MSKIRVGILFGGKSAEHEVSLQSARSVFEAIDKEKYEPVLIGIDKAGKWQLQDSAHYLLNADDPKLIKLNTSASPVALVPQSEGRIAALPGDAGPSVDVVFPVLHGTGGEDGTVQGLLKLADIPFVGAGVLGSAVGMDKDVMKRLLRDAGLPIARFLTIRSGDPLPEFDQVTQELGAPLFVKPANMGSSVGVSKVSNQEEFSQALKSAFDFDTKVVVEECVRGREIECSVLGNEHPIASVPGEVIPKRDFYSYEAKYIDADGADLVIPADLSEATVKKVQDAAIRTFIALNCEGLGRVDCFLKDDGTVVVNEINTIPGFTKISMYPKLWAASGLSYPHLIDRLITLAIERFEKEKRLKTSYTL